MFGWGCWTVNFPKYKKDPDRGANVTLNTNVAASNTSCHTVVTYYEVDTAVNRAVTTPNNAVYNACFGKIFP